MRDLVVGFIPVVLGAAIITFWAYALWDVLQRPEHDFPTVSYDISSKAFWTVVVLLLSGIGSLAYYMLVMRSRPRSRD